MYGFRSEYSESTMSDILYQSFIEQYDSWYRSKKKKDEKMYKKGYIEKQWK